MSSKPTADTALMRQYLDVKARYPDAVIFFRLGDFYEMFYEDAVFVAGALGLTLTTRDKGKEDPVPMCGVPHHAARGYLAKLTDLGRRVAVCEQLEDPKVTKGIVKRDVVRVVTPGVILDEETLDPRAPSHVAAIVPESRAGYGLAFVDVTTGDFRATEAASLEALIDELARVEPREVLMVKADQELASTVRRAYPSVAQTAIEIEPQDETAPAEALGAALGAGIDAVALAQRPLAARAAARVLRYVRATQREAPLPVTRLELYAGDEFLVIDEQARAHLELCETMLERRRQGSLLDVLDHGATAMGGRLLRRWLLFPLLDLAPIRRRQDAIERLVGASQARGEARRILGELADLERLAGRARLGVATPRDLVSIGRSLARLPDLDAALAPARGDLVGDDVDLLALGDLEVDLAARLGATLREDAPALSKEGGMIRPGVSAELDELVSIASGGRDKVLEIEARERERTGISTLKVRYNNVFGYYIEITRSNLAAVPADYTRKQTVANAERFVTPELSEYEHQIATAEERRIALELRIFEGLRAEVGAAAPRLLALAGRVAAADVLCGLAELAHRHGYVRPLVDDGLAVELEDARHPVVERGSAEGGFVPNDVRLDAEGEQVLLVTGPNMAGKSTLIRQVALSVILAQMGAFVPARRARLGLCDRVFTRVGAGDNLARGESTFLVEMRETAHILRHATRRSLVVLDEIGRGTSTYDGVSIAWAVAEHLHDVVGARTLFATHYHELCALAETHPRVRNVSVAAREIGGEIVFLRKLQQGGASRSFGVEVAKLAGLPATVIARSRAILGSLEAGRGQATGPRSVAPGRGASPQLGLFEAPGRVEAPSEEVAPHRHGSGEEVVEALRATDPDDLSPRAAWDLVVRLRKKLTDPPGRGRS
jgi:DNA mismatch repair protein MutS